MADRKGHVTPRQVPQAGVSPRGALAARIAPRGALWATLAPRVLRGQVAPRALLVASIVEDT